MGRVGERRRVLRPGSEGTQGGPWRARPLRGSWVSAQRGWFAGCGSLHAPRTRGVDPVGRRGSVTNARAFCLVELKVDVGMEGR